MTVAALLAAGRQAHLALMVDQCTVTRVTGQTWDSVTGQYTPTVATVYSGPCRVKPWRALDAEVAEAEVDVTRVRVDLPWGSPVVHRGATVTVTTSGNGWLQGAQMPVLESQLSSTATCQILLCQNAQQAQ